MDLKFYFSLFLRRLHWFLLFLIIGSAIGLTLARVLPPVYVAEARLLVETPQNDLAQSTVNVEATEQLQIIQQRILARDTLLELVNRLNIYTPRPGQARPDLSTDEIVEDMRERISIVTTGGTTRRGPALATLVNVSFEAPSGPLASAVANELVTLIQRENTERRRGGARNTLEFFEQEVDRLDRELAEAGAAILAFKEANQSALPDSLEFRRSQQAANQERLLQMEREEARLRDQRSRLLELRERMPAAAIAPTGPQSAEQRQLSALKEELSAQLLLLSPENPKIKILQARVDALQKTVDQQQIQSGNVTPEGAPLNQFDVQLGQIEGDLEFLRVQREQVQRALDDLQTSIAATPSNAITLDTLERDQANIRAQYDVAVAKRATAETGDIIESLNRGGRIVEIEPAVTPREPERPNRMVVAAGGIGGGFMLGLLAVFLGVFAFFLIGIPAVLWGVNSYVMPLDQLIDTLGRRIGLAQVTWPHLTALV